MNCSHKESQVWPDGIYRCTFCGIALTQTPITTSDRTHSETELPEEKKQGWISLDDERPEIAVIVNILMNDIPYSGFRAIGGWYVFGLRGNWYIPNDDEKFKVTDWQPLPEPPKI